MTALTATATSFECDPRADGSGADNVIALFVAEWKSGNRPRAEAWLSRLDPLNSSEAADLIFEEFSLAKGAGLNPSIDDYLQRFPEHRDRILKLALLYSFICGSDRNFQGMDDSLPEAGDEIGNYYLIRELGSGAFARVFLARETSLANRFVVVKVTSYPSLEASYLALSTHPNIVGIISQRHTEDGSLQIVTMPFLGGATLAKINDVAIRPRSGKAFLKRLDCVSAPEYKSRDEHRAARDHLAVRSYPQAVTWLFARLAQGLANAHENGVAHGDIKPANILITADGQPMLLDFNLAIESSGVDNRLVGGGTIAYMSPEALCAVARPNEAVAIDRRLADLYALGLVLVETLTGVAPSMVAVRERSLGKPVDQAAIAESVAKARVDGVSAFTDWQSLVIPAGLRLVLEKCLAPDPTRRYSSGLELATDLDRWQSDLPPVHANDGALPVRVGRFVRRNRITAAGLVLTIVLAATAGLLLSVQLRSTHQIKAEAKYNDLLKSDELGILGFRQLGSWVDSSDSVELIEGRLNKYKVLENADWRRSDDVVYLNNADRDDLEVWILEQILRLARSWSETGNASDSARALDLLDRESKQSTYSAFDKLRKSLRERLNRLGPIKTRASVGPRWLNSYLEGVYYEPNEAREAMRHFTEAANEREDLFWPSYRSASTCCRLNIYPGTVKWLRRAIAIRQTIYALHAQLAAALYQWAASLNRADLFEEALKEADYALTLNSDFAEGVRTRSYILEKLERSAERKAAVARFAEIMGSRGKAEVRGLSADFLRLVPTDLNKEALRNAEICLILGPHPADPDERVKRAGLYAAAKNHQGALNLVDDVLRDHTRHLGAKYGRVRYLQLLGRNEARLEAEELVRDTRFEELFRESPLAICLFCDVSVDLCEAGRILDAREIAAQGMLYSKRYNMYQGPLFYYQARVEAFASKSDPARLKLVEQYLKRSFELDPKFFKKIEFDSAFASIRREHPELIPAATQESDSTFGFKLISPLK